MTVGVGPPLKINLMRDPMFSQKTGVTPAGRPFPFNVLNTLMPAASELPSFIRETREGDELSIEGGPFAGPITPGRMLPKPPNSPPRGFIIVDPTPYLLSR